MTNTQAPTQAQIEAAAQAIFKQRFGRDWTQWDCKADAEAALTAAAQVGTFEAGPDECDTGVALTKAIDAVLAEDTPLVNHTIERCAQVADSFHAYDRPADEIAAAIRKLKEVDT
ncbi:MAG TPA: hypothetical protein VIJ87_16945 [Pyrinomonadaceae bacterium]